ncbi:MAG: DMT family transporter [Rhodospirillaceae bacterium]|nr:DMT family transporter [Rhodospirillaceae bacterium]
MQLALIAMCILAGGLLPAQAAMNAAVGLRTSGAMFAVGVNFFVGSAVLVFVLLLLRTPLPTTAQLQSVPWWAWAGGLCGIGVVFTTLYASPKLGATVAFAAIIAGQVGLSLLCDTFGWLNYQQQDLTPGRILGAVLLVAGVVMIRKF